MDSRTMKRGRGNPRIQNTAIKTKKKAKGAVEKAKEVAEKVVEGRKEGNEVVVTVEETAELEEWAGLWIGLDEEMSWATCWFPFWEMEAARDAYDALYGDVLWDYDIWGLKASGNNAPNP